MRVATFGYQTWGHKTLEALITSPHDVVLAVTHPPSDQPYESIWADSVEDLARDNGIPVHLAQRPDAELIARVKSAEPDIIVANNWRTWLPRELFDLPPHGTLNLHDSLLPKFTGFSPVIWAMISGATEVGLTAHRMDDELDTGDVVLQRAIPIGPDDTGTSLVRATIDLIPEVLIEALDLIEQGKATWTPQDLDERTFFHKRSARDSIIDWTLARRGFGALRAGPLGSLPECRHVLPRPAGPRPAASVSRCRYGGTPGRVFIAEGDGMVIVAGAARLSRATAQVWSSSACASTTARELPALEFFGRGGGYLTAA